MASVAPHGIRTLDLAQGPRVELDLFLLQVSQGGIPKPGASGGGTLLTLRMGREWGAMGAKVHFISNPVNSGASQYAGFYETLVIPGVQSSSLSDYASFVIGNLLNFFLQFRSLRTHIVPLIRASQKPILVATSPFPADLLCMLYLSKRTRTPGAVYIYHIPPAPWHHPFRRGSPLRALTSWINIQLALAVTKLSGFLPVIMNSNRSVMASGWRFRGGVLDLKGFQTGPPAYQYEDESTPPRDIDVAYVGRIAASKGLKDLIRASNIVLKRNPTVRVLICGWDPSEGYLDRLIRLVKKLGISRSVEIRGYVTPAEKAQLLKRVKLFVCSSYEEGWSLSVMEAAAAGSYPIVYDLPAYDYLGPLVSRVTTGDIQGLADSISSHLQTWPNLTTNIQGIQRLMASYRPSVVAGEQLLGLSKLLRPR